MRARAPGQGERSGGARSRSGPRVVLRAVGPGRLGITPKAGPRTLAPPDHVCARMRQDQQASGPLQSPKDFGAESFVSLCVDFTLATSRLWEANGDPGIAQARVAVPEGRGSAG